MAVNKKKILKVLIISLSSLIAIVLIALVLLNYYFKKSIEDALNQSLNANVKIEKVRINVFSSSIKIKKVSIIGNDNFKNDTLVYFDKTTIKLEDYKAKSGEIYLNTIQIDNPSIKVIIDEDGENCWQNIVKQNANTDTISLNNDFNLFVNNINVSNAQIIIIDKQTQSTNKFTNINFAINSLKTQNGFESNYKIDLITENTYFNSESSIYNFNLYGKINKDNETWGGTAKGNYAWLPLDLNFQVNLDSINKSESWFTACFNLDNTTHNTDSLKTNGKIVVDLKTNKQFIYDSSFNLKANVIFDNLSVINSNQEKLFLDFETLLSYSPYQHEKLLIVSDSLFIANNTDTISGFLNMSFNRDKFTSNTFINNTGDIHYSINDISMHLSAISNLNGIITKDLNNLKGLFQYSLKLNTNDISKDDNFELELFGAMDKLNFDYNLGLKSELIEGQSYLNINNISTYFKNIPTNIKSAITINNIILPNIKNRHSFDFSSKIETSSFDINFPQKINTIFLLHIDSISSEAFAITNINAIVKFGPNSIGIDNLSAQLFNGNIEATYLTNKTQKGVHIDNKYSIKDIDLSAFPNVDDKLEGLLNISGENSIFSTKDTVDYSHNTGYNIINLSKFKLKTDFLKEYEIDEDFISISNADLEITLNKDSLELIPTDIAINKALLKLDATYLISSDNINANILINTPEEYLSKKIQLLIQFISDSKKEKSKKQSDRLQYLLKITGKTDELKYKIYKL
ncbi:MAG: AsmA family protein [Bacteroidales bacterium]|nr:AsmA family protein [Bacteroidales bacterium]